MNRTTTDSAEPNPADGTVVSSHRAGPQIVQVCGVLIAAAVVVVAVGGRLWAADEPIILRRAVPMAGFLAAGAVYLAAAFLVWCAGWAYSSVTDALDGTDVVVTSNLSCW